MASYRRHLTRINKKLQGIVNYQPMIPLTTIFQCCEEEGLVPLQEDNRRWSGLLCGDDSRAVFPLGAADTVEDGVYKPTKHTLLLSWYRRSETGNYDINMYVS